MTNSTGPSAVHPAVTAYATRHHLDMSAIHADGRLTLRFDERYRIHLRPAADGRIAVTSRLLDLAERSATETEEALLRLASLGGGTLREQAATLCVDEKGNAVLLQQLLAADTDADSLELELADYVNTLAFWRQACSREAVGRA
jgi:hypothetical protein